MEPNAFLIIGDNKMTQQRLQIIEAYLDGIIATLERLPVERITDVIEAIEKARISGKTIFTFGNGGSAATASHFASDLSKGATCEGKPRIKAFALTENVSLLSAWANDTSYNNIFAEQLENVVEPGDIAIGISGSGNSPNVLNGAKLAKNKGAITIGFVGFDGGKLKELVEVAVIVPNHNMEQVEDIHLLLEHVITTCLRKGT
jgi:D-sedoheptulose 7-phosphate isomerase